MEFGQKRTILVLLVVLSCFLTQGIYTQDITSIPDMSAWKTFVSRGGWTLRCPLNWVVSSCTMCIDLAAPNIYVIFGDTKGVTRLWIDPLRDKPQDKDADEWLNELKVT